MAAFDELQVITDPDQLGYQVNPASYVAGTEEILIDTTNKKISLKVIGNLKIHGATIKAVYSKLKDAWRADTTLIKFPFPMGPITDEQFEMINDWNWNTTGSVGITLSTASYNGGTDQITFTTSSAHGISVGDVVTIAGVTPSTYNGTYVTITGTTGSTIVVGEVTVDPGTYSTGGTVSNYLLTTELVRTGGWSVVSAGNVNEYWSSCITLGTLGTTDQVYYQQLNTDASAVNFKLTGKVNQAVQIYYYDGTGTRPDIEALSDASAVDGTSFVLRRYLKLFVREWDKLYAQSEIADIGVSQLTYQAYRFPLTNSADLKVTHSEEFVSLGSPIQSIQGDGTTVTCNTTVAHGLVTGDYVDIAGTTTYDGNFQVTVTDTDTFTFLAAGTANVTTGFARKAVYGNIIITYLRDSNGAFYDIRGTVANTTYAIGDVVQEDNGAGSQWFACTVAGTVTGSAGVAKASWGGTSTFVTYVGERQIGNSYYAFSTIIDADNTVAAGASGAARTTEIYEQVQYYLRQGSDIDSSAGSVTGKTASALLRFVGDTLVTSTGVYIESFNTQDTNAIEFFDYSGTSRTFPFVATLTVNFGPNLQDDQYSKYWIFFTTASVGNYGTSNAVLVQDTVGTVMGEELSRDHRINPDWVIEGTPVKRTFANHSYNYDSNDQRGGGTYNSGDGVGDTAKTDAPITVVAIGLKTGQFVTATGTIARSTSNAVTLTASLERNYSAGVTYP